MGLGGLHGRRLQKTGDSYSTIIAILKSVTCPALDRPADLPGAEDTTLTLFMKLDIYKKADWQCISETKGTGSAYPNGAQFSLI
jgi:hypothetical protein